VFLSFSIDNENQGKRNVPSKQCYTALLAFTKNQLIVIQQSLEAARQANYVGGEGDSLSGLMVGWDEVGKPLIAISLT